MSVATLLISGSLLQDFDFRARYLGSSPFAFLMEEAGVVTQPAINP